MILGRSHAFLSMVLEKRTKAGESEYSQPSQIHLVDLAGSENFDV